MVKENKKDLFLLNLKLGYKFMILWLLLGVSSDLSVKSEIKFKKVNDNAAIHT